ncbi:hypothetical protein [Pseudocolwellia sp. HL-MZ7]|uniref:hypothetical protein n=1 Tax=Pseudocolwellia sp. HL-MZ7 TaxID=3400627 RepID=UPI003CF32636
MKKEASEQVQNIPFPSIAVTEEFQIITANELALNLLDRKTQPKDNSSLFDSFFL